LEKPPFSFLSSFLFWTLFVSAHKHDNHAVRRAVGPTRTHPPPTIQANRLRNLSTFHANQNSLQGSTEVGLVIGLVSCTSDPTGVCPSADSQIGNILFNGDYDPQLHEQPGRPYQNFTVTVPAQFALGAAQVATARFQLIGVRLSSFALISGC